MGTVQVRAVPKQAPAQPDHTEPASGIAVRADGGALSVLSRAVTALSYTAVNARGIAGDDAFTGAGNGEAERQEGGGGVGGGIEFDGAAEGGADASASPTCEHGAGSGFGGESERRYRERRWRQQVPGHRMEPGVPSTWPLPETVTVRVC